MVLAAAAALPLALVVRSVLDGAGGGTPAVQDVAVRATPPPGPHPSPLAVNLAELHYWSAQLAYADLFRQASRWHREDLTTWAWDSGPPLALDEHGWVTALAPNQAASVLIARGPDGLLPEGTYEVRWTGSGKLQVLGDAVLVAADEQRLQLSIADSTTSGIQLRLVETDPSDPLRDLRVFPPGVDPDDPGLFHPGFLELLSRFRAVRFMDWQRTNGSELAHWDERSLPSDAVQTGEAGVCVEHMVALCNAVDADAWFCMPHLADDDFVREFARLVEAELEPGLRVFVEFSNEVWNGGFPQAHHAAQQGAQLGLSGSTFQNQLRWYSQRAVEVFELWREVFGQDSQRLVCVLAGQSVNPWTGQVVLGHQGAHLAADAYAVAPYFGARLGSPEEAPGVLALDRPALLQRLRDELDVALDMISENVALAEEHGLPLLAYEAGQHLVGVGPMQSNQELTDLFVALNRDPFMAGLYATYLEHWRQSGAHEMFLWNLADKPSQFGSWGLLERSTQDPSESPKFRAVASFLEAHEPWW